MNLISERTKMHSGDCFYYKSDDAKLNIGFVLLEKKAGAANEENGLEFALIELNNGKSIDSFLNGYVFTINVQEGLNEKKSQLGVYSLNFNKDCLKLLDNFIYVGNIRLSKNKFIVGAGGSALFVEKAFLVQIKNTDKILVNSKKMKVRDILM